MDQRNVEFRLVGADVKGRHGVSDRSADLDCPDRRAVCLEGLRRRRDRRDRATLSQLSKMHGGFLRNVRQLFLAGDRHAL